MCADDTVAVKEVKGQEVRQWLMPEMVNELRQYS